MPPRPQITLIRCLSRRGPPGRRLRAAWRERRCSLKTSILRRTTPTVDGQHDHQLSLLDVAPRHAQPIRQQPPSQVARSTGLEVDRRHAGELVPEPVLTARGSDPDTSHQALAAFDRATMARAAHLVVEIHRQHGPLADFELEPLFAVGYRQPCCAHLYRQARSAARDRGLIRDSRRHKRNPITNREQILWEACAEALPVLHRCEACGHLLRRREGA